MNIQTTKLRECIMHKEKLAENLKDLLNDLESGHVPYVRKVEELMVA